MRCNTSEVSPLLPAELERAKPAAAPETGGSFGAALAQAVGQVDGLQQAADQQSAQVAKGEGNLHEVALALEKADVAMRVLVKARNKVVEAYNEVMRMSV